MVTQSTHLSKDCYPNWYRTHTVSKFGLLSSWITGACHYTRLRDLGNPKHNQSQVLKERYQLFLEQFAREIHGAETYTSFSDTFKKIVPHLQSLGKNILIKRTYYLIFFLLKNRVIEGNKRSNTKYLIVRRA